MLSSFRLKVQAIRMTSQLLFLGLLFSSQNAFSNDPAITSSSPWIVMECSAQASHVHLRHDSRRAYKYERPTFVITHGMGGTEPGDRFHQLADAISDAIPECNVLMIDWSKQSSFRTAWLGLPNPFAVARNIDPVALEASALLRLLQLAPEATTFVGESFGNCVNARIAKAFDGKGRILAFNPANEAGGYRTPDLKACSDCAWSFQTYSMFDTQEPIADASLFLETSPMATDYKQHIAGVSWLSERVRAGDRAWLLGQHRIPDQQAGSFDAIATLSGELLHHQPTRKRPQPDYVAPPAPRPMLLASTAIATSN